jgi:hypothetical protein
MLRRPLTLLAAALLAATLSAPGAASADRAGSAAAAGTTAPAVGSCHALTGKELQKAADPDRAVSCDDPHTSLTVKVITFTTAPDWGNLARLAKRITTPCYRALIGRSGGNAKTLRMSAYSLAWFIPTSAQRDAGAKWVRCDLYLAGGSKLLPLPANDSIALGALPLSDRFAKCRAGKRGGYAVTSCSRGHAFRAKIAIKYPHSSYPGPRAANRFALRKCRARLDGAFYYEAVLSKQSWKAGFRHAICLPRTSA